MESGGGGASWVEARSLEAYRAHSVPVLDYYAAAGVVTRVDVARVHDVAGASKRAPLEALVLDPGRELLQDGGVDLLGESPNLILGQQVGTALDDRCLD